MLADHLFAHGLVPEMLAGPLAGMYDPSGHGKLLFAAYEQRAAEEEAGKADLLVAGRS
ncbi:hypothetical protein [Streptomyces acidicola]|uniref:hypothetical protein n=1 Tax=Streptomyces acidicola TaxID=2596892 RepID=UPI001D150DCE|nr:hypothetical protein [Streptomyces acidicola]